MILIDTSVWIEMLAGRPGYDIREEDLPLLATCAPVIQEIVQGLRPGAESEKFRRAFLAIPVLSDPLPLSTFLPARPPQGLYHSIFGGLSGGCHRAGTQGSGMASRPRFHCDYPLYRPRNRLTVDASAVSNHATLGIGWGML
jgi:hypothetical protein